MEIVIGLIIGLAVGGVVALLVSRQVSELKEQASQLRMELDQASGLVQERELAQARADTELAQRIREVETLTKERDEARLEREERASSLTDTKSKLAAKEAAQKELQHALDRDRTALAQRSESLDAAQGELTNVKSELEAIRAADQTRQDELNKQREQLDTHFKGIASEVAKSSNEEFRKQASDDFKRQRELADQELKQHVEPVGKELEQLRKYVSDLEKERAGAYEGVNKLITETQKQVGRLSTETGDLREILRSSRHRGRWGETTLENILELAGMRRGKDFNTQLSGELGSSIADFVVRMPGGKKIIIDSKTPFDAYRDALNSATEAEQTVLLGKHAATVLSTAAALKKTGYDKQFEGSMDFVVMWIPTDSILEGATRVMPDLIEKAFADHRVLLATPVTMIALVSGVAAALHQEEQQELLHKNALEIQQAGERLYNGVRRHATVYAKLGKQLDSAVRTYDEGVSSIQGNLLQGAKQMRDLGGGEGEEAPEPDELRLETKAFRSRELRELADSQTD